MVPYINVAIGTKNVDDPNVTIVPKNSDSNVIKNSNIVHLLKPIIHVYTVYDNIYNLEYNNCMNPKLTYLDLDQVPTNLKEQTVELIESLLEFFDPEQFVKDCMLLQLIVNNSDKVIEYIDKRFPESKKSQNAKTLIARDLVTYPKAWNHFCDKLMFTKIGKMFPDSIDIFTQNQDPKNVWNALKDNPNLLHAVTNESLNLGMVKSVTYFFNRIPIIVFDEDVVDPDSQGTSSSNGIRVYATKDENLNILKNNDYKTTVRHELVHQILEFKCTITHQILEILLKTDRAKYLELRRIQYLQSMFSELNAYFFEDPNTTLVFENDNFIHRLSLFELKETKPQFNPLTDKEYFDIKQDFIPKIDILNQFIANSINNTIDNQTQNSETIRRTTLVFKLMFGIKNFEQLPTSLEGYNKFID